MRIRHWSTQIVDVEHGQLLDTVAGRDGAGACAWFAQRPDDNDLLTAIRWATLDLSGPIAGGRERVVPIDRRFLVEVTGSARERPSDATAAECFMVLRGPTRWQPTTPNNEAGRARPRDTNTSPTPSPDTSAPSTTGLDQRQCLGPPRGRIDAFGMTNWINYRTRAVLYAGRPNWSLLNM